MTFTPLSPEEIGWIRRDLLASFVQTVTLASYTGTVGAGSLKPAYGVAKPYPARVTNEYRQIINHEGQQDLSTVQVFIYPFARSDGSFLATLDVRSLMTLSDGTTPPIKQLRVVQASSGDLIFYEILT